MHTKILLGFFQMENMILACCTFPEKILKDVTFYFNNVVLAGYSCHASSFSSLFWLPKEQRSGESLGFIFFQGTKIYMVCSSWVCHWIGNRLSSWCPDSLTPTCTSLSGTSIANLFICCLNIVVGIYLPVLECWIAQLFLVFWAFGCKRSKNIFVFLLSFSFLVFLLICLMVNVGAFNPWTCYCCLLV